MLDAEELDDVVIGRRDPHTGDAPPVDLTDAEALEKRGFAQARDDYSG